MGRRNTTPVYSEKLSLLVPDKDEFRDRTSITWQEASKLTLATLLPVCASAHSSIPLLRALDAHRVRN